MAIIKTGPIVVGIRGTLAGTIFSANKAGPFARSWSRGANPRQPLQTIQRGIIGSLPAGWRALTPVQQAAWDTWAALIANIQTNPLGETYYLSGWQSYVKINTRLTVAGRVTRTAPPVIGIPAQPTISTLNARESGGPPDTTITFPNNTFLGYDCILFAAMAQGPGVINQTTGWRSMLAGAPDGAAFHVFQTELDASFGVIQVDQRLFVRMARQTTDGERSSFATDFDDVI